MAKTILPLLLVLFSCGHVTKMATICTCEQLEKVALFVSDNTQKANNMSDEEMEDVIQELRRTGIKLYCEQRPMKYASRGDYSPDWEIQKLDSCESYHFVYID